MPHKPRVPSDREIVGGLIDELQKVPILEEDNSPPDSEREWSDRIGERRGKGKPRVETASAEVRSEIAVSQGYQKLVADLSAQSLAFRQNLARAFCSTFNEELACRPHDDLESKKALSKWANAELRQFGLAIQCPKTGVASFLIAHPGNHPDIGRFQIYHDSEKGKKVTVTSTELPCLELMPATLGPQNGHRSGKWADRHR